MEVSKPRQNPTIKHHLAYFKKLCNNQQIFKFAKTLGYVGTASSQKTNVLVNYKMVALIFGIAAIWQILNGVIPREENTYDFFDLSLTFTYPAAAAAAFYISKRYWSYDVFGKSYLSLGLAFLSYFIGDEVYFYQENIMHIDAYPSIADAAYFAFYPFAMYHLLKNSFYFKRKVEIKTKMWLSAFPALMVVSYFLFSYFQMEDLGFDFYYGLIFVSANAILLSFAILGAQVFRKSSLGPVWGLIVLGLIFYTAADAWYYHLEIYDQYTGTHIVNVLWLISSMLIIYALYKHRKAM